VSDEAKLELKLLVEWSSPWHEFVTSIGPALASSPARLAGETPYGMFPYRGMLLSWVAEILLLAAFIFLPAKIASLRPYAPPQMPKYDVIYFSGDELPHTEDFGGAQSGRSGRAGGREAHHRTQTIRIARGGSMMPTVVDAPRLRLPVSSSPVANLLAIKPNAGPPPSEGLRATLTLPADLIENVVAPAPARVSRDKARAVPSLSSLVVPPPADVSGDKPRTLPSLSASAVPPTPDLSRDSVRRTPALSTAVVPPAPADPFREKTRLVASLNANVAPPAPAGVSREPASTPLPMSGIAVVPPPVSAPERATNNPKLTLPAPAVVAPPPSAQLSRDLRAPTGGSLADPTRSVVLPPAQAGSGSMVKDILGKLFGTTDVPPPPAQVEGHAARTTTGGLLGSKDVVPPPPPVTGASSTTPRAGDRGGLGGPAVGVVPPPPSAASLVGGSARTAPIGSLGGTSVVPPPPSVAGSGSLASRGGGLGGSPVAGGVVPPPPTLAAGAQLSSQGRGGKGSGLGGPLDAGSVLAPPGGGGSGGSTAVVASTQPGSKVGLPSGAGTGSIALSPSGGADPGLGGSGGGSGIGRGNGPGSGLAGEGTGAGKEGIGRGSDPKARGGISPYPGSGGAGSGSSGTPPVPGVAVSGGTTVVTLPSFGPGSNDPSLPGRSSVKEKNGPDITIVATSRSGGAFNFYGTLPGDNYTIYLNTSAGTVVMQFADPTSATRVHYAGDLTAPQQLRTDLPAGLPRARLVIACVLDRSGNLGNLRVLETGPAVMTAKVLAALPSWKFRPATRGNQPVEVNAILGFGIDTNDRY